MKKALFIPIAAVFTLSALFTSCKPSREEQEAQENVQEAKQEVEEAKEDLAQAKRQANAEEWQNFKDEMNATIEKNDARIAEIKRDIKKSGKAADAKLDQKIDALKEKNEELKLRIKTYKNEADSDWESFKREFSHDMDEIGNAFKDLTVDNKN